MTGVAGTMERECKPRRRLLIPPLQDEPRRDPAPDRGVLSGMFLIHGGVLDKSLGNLSGDALELCRRAPVGGLQ